MISIILISGCLSFSKQKSGPIQDSQSKMLVREFTSPISDAFTFNQIVQSVITDNPLECDGYVINGTNHAPIEKIKEFYTVRILDKDNNGIIVNTSEETFNSYADYESATDVILPMAHDSKFDIFGSTLKCHDVNGEIYYVVFTREDVTLAAYSDDSIRVRFETWADTITLHQNP